MQGDLFLSVFLKNILWFLDEDMKRKNAIYDDNYAMKQILKKESYLRPLIKRFYLNRVLKYVNGPTVDFGCGAGQLLERLPLGSVGVEVNPYLINYLEKNNLNVIKNYQIHDNGIDLHSFIKKNEYKCLVLSHIIEHFDNAKNVFLSILKDSGELGIERIIIVIPGLKGYKSDVTHKTFIDIQYLTGFDIEGVTNYKLIHSSYFPGNIKSLGSLFSYHELMMVYEIANDDK